MDLLTIIAFVCVLIGVALVNVRPLVEDEWDWLHFISVVLCAAGFVLVVNS